PFPVDVRIAASPDVSREHLRIRRDPASGAFFLIDLSTLGTTLNGRHVPRGFDDRGREARERRGDGAARRRPDRACRHGVPRVPQGRLMAWLLWARFVVLALLIALVASFAWMARRDETER